MEADFSGYATKAGLRCSDGRTIMPQAFQHMDKITVPLVWQHGHNSPENVLGHAILEARPDGVYAYGFFNDTPAGQQTKALVQHKDINKLSIFANQLVEKTKQVLHGTIREVSLVLAGANPGALIDFVRVIHGDDPNDIEILHDEAEIHTGLELDFVAHSATPEQIEHAGQTVRDIYETMTPEQKDVLLLLVEEALAEKDSAAHSAVEGETNNAGDNTGDNTGEGENLEHQEGTEVTRNVFEQNGAVDEAASKGRTLAHDAMKSQLQLVMDGKQTFKQAVAAVQEDFLQHGIENIDVLFPEARTVGGATPQVISRRMAWVAPFINKISKTPFSRVKTLWVDLTQEEARALGYIKGHYKKEEWVAVTKRTTSPTTVYKKQKLDRDDVIDITDFDIVAWMRAEMRVMIEEELARAALLGDGRDPGSEDHIADPMAATSGNGIRSILNEHELFATTVNINLADSNSSYIEVIDEVVRSRKFYKGSGSPTLYTTNEHMVNMLLLRDEANSNRRLYNTKADLAAALLVDEIVEVEVMEKYPTVLGIIVNMADYTFGANKGGELTNFEDFDIDYNQHKYLIETRLSGALTMPNSAIILKLTTVANLVAPITQPSFVSSTGVVTIPAQTGVVYKNADTEATITAGAMSALAAGASIRVKATPAATYYFRNTVDDGPWTYKRPAA